MTKHYKLSTVLFITILIIGCGKRKNDFNDSITVFCGSANKPAMEKIANLFEQEKKIKVHMIFGGSGTLLSQIELSKKGEIYLPGSPDYIIIGNNKKLLIKGSDQVVSYLIPAIITPKGNPKQISSLNDLTKPGIRIAIGNPKTVCLGLYGIELLEKNGLLEDVLKNVVTFGASCSKTANLAAMKKVDAILGWRVFHFWNPERMDYIPISKEQIPRISYTPISIPIFTKDINLSKMFIDFVLYQKGNKVYEDLGYIVKQLDAKKFAPQATIGGEFKLPKKYFDFISTHNQKK